MEYQLPDFYPDATKGVIRSCNGDDIKNAGINGIIVNTYHLLTEPGTEVLAKFGGIKNYMNFHGTVISDSGGWQMFSLIHKNKGLGKITENGVIFYKTTKSGRKKYEITPEKCIQIQFDINPDIMICLDYFTDPKSSRKLKEVSVKTTVDWARRCKAEFDRLCAEKGLDENSRPKLFCVLQGGREPDLVKDCAEGLAPLNFDGWGLGGWLFDDEKNLDMDIVKLYGSCMPNDKPKYALGIGTPQHVVDCVKTGFDIFDCVLPTRDARHKRLFVYNKPPSEIDFAKETDWCSFLYISRERYKFDQAPLSEFCDCHTCKNYSRSYIRHLFEIQDTLAYRLCTIHNLRVYAMLMENLRLR